MRWPRRAIVLTKCSADGTPIYLDSRTTSDLGSAHHRPSSGSYRWQRVQRSRPVWGAALCQTRKIGPFVPDASVQWRCCCNPVASHLAPFSVSTVTGLTRLNQIR